MGAGWIATGPDTPAPTGADAPKDPWTPVAPDAPSTPALVRPHQDPTAHPVDNTRGLLTRGKQLLFGHEPENSQDPDQHYQTGVLSSLGESVDDSVHKFSAPGPDMSTLATAYPHLVGAQVEKAKAGYQETYGAAQVQSAEQTIAALNVLPQVAARSMGPGSSGIPDIPTMAKDPAVQKTAIKLGLDPTVFAGQWAQYAGMSPEEQADAMARAKDAMDKGAQNVTAGRSSRASAWADERAWQPTDLMHGKLDPWTLKGIAFNTALAIPDLAIVAGATAAGTAVGSPGLGVAAGAGTAVALFAPQQRAEAKDKIDDQVSALLQKADAWDYQAPIGGKRGLNPVTNEIRQQAADLAANSDKIANTAGVLYAVADAAGAVPVSSVLARSPVGKAMLDRMVGAAASKTVGGRIGGAMVANGAGGVLQASIQKAVDAGIVHENTPLSDALKDIAYTGIVAAATAAPIAAAHEAIGAPGRAQARRNLDSDDLLNRVKTAADNLSAGPKPSSGEEYPGYKWNQTTGKYEPTETNAGASATRPRIAATEGQSGATNAPEPETPPTGAAATRAAYQAKTQTLNEAAAKAEKRSDVSLQPEEEGWSVHVKGEPVAHFDTATAAHEAMAAARKLVGTKPATQESTQEVQNKTSPAPAAKESQAVSRGAVPQVERPGAPSQGPRTDMDLSPEERALERERVAAQRDAEEGVSREHEPEPIPKRAAESEGEAARRDSETGLPGTGGTPAAAQDLAPNGKPRIKEHTTWHGLPIGIENTAGTFRSFKLPDGTPAKRKMRVPYGEFTKTEGADGDGVDVFIAGNGDKAHVIDQLDASGKKFDEHKVVLGAKDAAAAKQTYLDHYQKGWKGFGGITELEPNQLKRWLKEGDLNKPIDPESVPAAKVVRGVAPDARHDSILQFLARHPRGLDRQEAISQGIDPADMGSAAAHVGIKRAFRNGGMSFDHAAEALHEAGYPVADKQGHYSPNVLLDRLDDELRGNKHYSVHNESQLPEHGQDWRHPLSDEDLAKLTIAQTHTRLEALREEQERLEREIERAGLTESSDEETREDLDRIPFQRKAGVQQDLFGDKVAVQNEIKRHEAALDKKRNSGQESVETGKADDLFSKSRQQMDLPKIGEETTRYALRKPSPSTRTPKNVRPAGAVPQLDLFANAATPTPATQAARLAQSVKLAHIGEFRSGITQVKTWEDAAHILAPLRKNPQENMTALVVDKAGKPLAVIRHSIGASDSANVEPWSLAGSIVQVPGASSVYFAHNHPSGVVSQSGADEAITKKLHNLLEGSGILPRGMIVVGPNSKTASYFLPEMGYGIESPIPAARRSGQVPMQERRYARLGGDIGPLTGASFKGPDAAKAAIIKSGEKSGVVLVNQRHQVVGIVPMSAEEMLKLRSGSKEHGAARLLKAMSEANANTMIAFGHRGAALNTAIFGNAAGARSLDAMYWDKNGELQSSALANNMPDRGDENFLQRGDGTRKGGMSVPEIRATVDKFIEGFAIKPDVVIAKNLAELQRDPEIGESLKDEEDGKVVGFFHPATGKIYLIGDQFQSPSDVAATMAHEFVGHFGLRAAFGDRRAAQYQAILDGMRKAMPAEFRRLGALYFPKGFNPLNAHHRNVAAEEVLTHYGMRYVNDQSVPAQAKRWLDKLLAMLRDWFRSAFGLPKKFDELFVKRTLADLESFLRRGRSGTKDGQRTETEPAFAHSQDTFFSGLAKAVDAAKRDKGTGAEWEATLRNMPGVKAEEMQWVGLKDWLEGRGRVSKQEVAEFVHAHTVQIGEVQHGGVGQRGLNDDELRQLNERMEAAGYGGIEGEQAQTLRRGGPDTEHMLEELHRMGVSVEDMHSPVGHEGVIDQLKKLGYQVHEDDVTGSPYLMQVDESGVAHEVADGDVPDNARDLLSSLREGPMSPPKYPQWATPGGSNYRELLMTLPEAKEDVAANARAKASAAARLKAETDSRAYERAFMDFVPEYDQVLRANASHWLADAATPRGTVIRTEAVEKLHAAVDAMSHAFRSDARHAMQQSIVANRVLYDATREDISAQGLAKNGGNYRSQHWDEKNVLAHVRFDDRTGPNGERVLHLHEIQSDWHQSGRRSGYKTDKPPTDQEVTQFFGLHEVEGVPTPFTPERMEAYRREMMDTAEYKRAMVPDAPFKTTWPELAIKRMLRYAAERGYDALSWDTGETNAERYNMQQVADKIHVTPIGNDTYSLIARKGNTTVAEHNDLSEKKLADLIGKDMAQRAITRRDEGVTTFKGDDLKVGGAGMRGFYDDILPKTVNKLVKKWGSSVEPGTVAGEREGELLTNDTDHPRGWDDGAGGMVRQRLPTQIPAHIVRITPAMRDSVMAGQPMFLKRRKGSSGTPAPAPKKGAYDLARRAVAAIPNNEFTLSLRRIADPAGVSEASKATAIVTREALGELAQASEEALKNLEQYSKAFDLLSIPDRYEFIDAMEGGKPTRPDLQLAADAIRKLLDGWRENIRGLGVGALDNFIENYFPHIWQRDDRAKKIFGQIFGRRPLKGPASFLKERTIPTTREGLEAGLQPISSNPLVLAFAKLREMQRFYTGVKLMQRFKDEGLAKFLPSHKLRPDDWAEINDAVGRVRQWSEVEQGFIERGKYIMPTDAARVINNHLSASALRNFLPAQIFRSMSNAANALQLGFSAFHLGFTTLDAVVSKNALAIERLLHGEPLKAAQSFLEASTGIGGAGMNLLRGQQLLKAYSNISGATPQMRRIVEGLMAAGGKVKMDRYFMAAQGLSPFKGVGFATLASDVKGALTQPYGKVQAATQVLTSFPQQYAMRLWRDLQEVWRLEPLKVLPIVSALEIAGRMTRASTSIIMEHIVPLQKLGVFSDLAADHIRRNPLEDPVAFADAMQRIWNSVDNRLGEMVYDNVFWNRTFKDVNHMLVRAVGWNLGTIRELGGAPIDVVKVLDYLARGAPAEAQASPLGTGAQARQGYEEAKSKFQRIAEKVGHKIPYTLALIATTMILGAALTYLFTGKGPEETKDYFFPWTGRKTKYGTKERISMPSYTKDLYEYGTQPMTTIINKANPIFGIIHSIYANEDFFGDAVRFPDDSWEKQTWDSILYGARQVQPFSLQGTKQFVGAGDMDARGKVLSTMPYVGFGPAPARVTSPEQMERYQLRETEKKYIRGLQRRLKQATEKGDKEEVQKLRDEIRDSKLKERGTERDIRQDKIKAVEAAKKISSLIEGRSREEAAAALTQAGLPAFAQLWRSLPEHPKPRVAESLQGFA
jgi:Inorganic Pyrophosphatase/RadC-like JAB domain